MERWTKHVALALQDPFVSQWDKGANLRPLEERIGDTCNESQKVLEGKSLAVDADLFARGFQKSFGCEWGKTLSYYVEIGSGSQKVKVLEEKFSWWVTDDNEDMFFPALQTAASPPLALLTKINSCFHLFQCIFGSAPQTLLQVFSLQGCNNWNNSTLSIHMLNSDSPTIPPTSCLENLRKAVLLRSEKNSWQVIADWVTSSVSCPSAHTRYFIYRRQMRTISNLECPLDQI